MKKIVALLLVFTLGLAITSCGKKNETAKMQQETTSITETTPQPKEGAKVEVSSNTKSKSVASGSDVTGGTNQNDAVLLPLEKKLYGTISNGGPLWFAFTTGSGENTTYSVTTVNKTTGTAYLRTAIFDDKGNSIKSGDANSNGVASAIHMDNLLPNTKYYISLTERDSKNTIHYMLRITERTSQGNGRDSSESIMGGKGNVGAQGGELIPGTNQDDAALVPLNAKISDTVRDGVVSWFAFTTNSAENAEYKFTTVNEASGTSYLRTAIYDEYGKQLKQGDASSDGKASTISINKLPPNTTYYIAMSENNSKDIIHYTLSIQAPETEESVPAVNDTSSSGATIETMN